MAELTSMDRQLADAVIFKYAGDKVVKFQFPPRITSDSKGMDWKEGQLLGEEPVAVAKTAKARAFTMEWTYICGMGAHWSTQHVKDEVEKMKKYFYRAGDLEKLEEAIDELVVKLKFWKYGGTESQTCRMETVSITHGKTILVPDGDVSLAYPLRTDVKADLKLWTRQSEKVDLDVIDLEVKEGWF